MRRFKRRRRSRGRWLEVNSSPLNSWGFVETANSSLLTFTPIPLNHNPLVGGVNAAGLSTGGDLKGLQRFRPRRLVGTINYGLRRIDDEGSGQWIARILEAYAVLNTDDNGLPSDTERWDQILTLTAQTSDLPFVWQHYEQVVFGGTHPAGTFAVWNNADHNPIGNYRDLQVRRTVRPQSNLYLLTCCSVIQTSNTTPDNNWELHVAHNIRCYAQ